MEIKNTEVSGIRKALHDMRNPKESWGQSDTVEYYEVVEANRFFVKENLSYRLGDKDFKLAKALSNSKSGEGHDCFLKGINVLADITAGHGFWLQWMRYHFADIVSSTSKMHMVTSGNIAKKCSKWVSDNHILFISILIDVYNGEIDPSCYAGYIGNYSLNGGEMPESKEELYECIIDNVPLGYQLTGSITTNYLQLKSMWKQRKNHKMGDWNRDFVEWVRSLPLSWLITGEFDD